MQLGMVLEGGGIRGVYTAGVLDYLMERDFYPEGIIGVSAGACHGASYASKQKGRSWRIQERFGADSRYMGMGSWLKTGDFFNADFAYRRIPDELEPFDYETYDKNRDQMPFYAVVTNVDTGEAEYIRLGDMHRDVAYVRASASLPVFARIVGMKDKRYLDGGVSDSIPIEAAKQLGFARNIVILTRTAGYRKEPNRMMPLINAVYKKKYPRLAEAVSTRYMRYNASLDMLSEEEKAGRAFVLRPSKELHVGRMERDQEKVKALYTLGYQDAERNFAELLRFREECR